MRQKLIHALAMLQIKSVDVKCEVYSNQCVVYNADNNWTEYDLIP